MPYKNPTEILIDATKFPAKVEAMLPNGAPKISTTLADVATRLPTAPDFPVEIPDLPAPPELPAAPAGLGLRTPFAGPGEVNNPAPSLAGNPVRRRPEEEVVRIITP